MCKQEVKLLFHVLMNRKELLEKYQIFPKSVEKKRNVDIIGTPTGRYVLKKGDSHTIYEYLETRNFHNLPRPITIREEGYLIYPYIDDSDVPKEQRVEDFIYLLSILHTKTTFYKTVELDNIKEIFETIRRRQDYLIQYYHNLQDMIETEKYMAPSHYLLIRNLSLIYFHLTESKIQIEKWYDLMKEHKKMRYVMTHGNLKKEHFIENRDLYLISWENARINLPAYDLENFYRNNWRETTLHDFLEIYQSKYLLRKEELSLFLSLIHLPEKIELGESELQNIRMIHVFTRYHEQLEEWKIKTPPRENSSR